MSELATGTYQDLAGGLAVDLAPEKLVRRDQPLPSPDLSNVHADGADLVSRRGWARWLDLGAQKRAYMVTFISALTLGDLLAIGEDTQNQVGYGGFYNPIFPPVPSTPAPAATGFRITAPVHGATCQLLELPITWTAATGATAYRVMIHTSRTLPTALNGPIDPAQLTWAAQLPAAARTVTVPDGKLVNATVYYLWVDALVRGTWLPAASTPHKFTTKLLAPTGLTTGSLAGSTPTLTWDANFAAAWVVQIRTGNPTNAQEFAALPILHTSRVLTQASYTVPPNLLALNTIYAYTVTARDVAAGTPGCEITSAITHIMPEAAVVDTIALNYSQSSPICAQRGAAAVNTGKSYPFPTKLRVSGNFTVDDWSTVNGIVWHTTGYSTQCSDSRVVNTHALTNGYVLKTNGTGSDIIIPANTPIVFVITDTIGISHRLIGTLEVLAT